MKSLGKFPDPFLAEICGQPDALRRSAAALVDQRDALARLQRAKDSARTIAFTGMGSSYDACYPAVNDLAARALSAILVDSAELLHFRRPMLGPHTLLVVVSQSGQSAEVVKLVEQLANQRYRPFVVSVSNGTDNALAERADLALDTWAGSESGPSTMTFAAALVTLTAVSHVLAGGDLDTAVDRTRTAAEGAAQSIERLVDTPEEFAAQLGEWLGDRRVMVLLGRGPARAAAEMGALLIKEATGLPAESLEAAMFRHGPLEMAGPDMAAFVFATEPETRRLDIGLAADLIDTGAAVLVVTPDGEAPAGALAVATGYLDRALTAAASVVPAQLLAWRVAVLRGKHPGEYTRATKVTTRE